MSGGLVLLALLAALSTALAPSSAVSAPSAPYCPPQHGPQFAFGFATLSVHLGAAMGEPTTCEHGDPLGTGDTLQRTTTGLAFYRQATNTATFTDGWQRWAWTPDGLLSWEGQGIDLPGFAVAPAGPPSDVPHDLPLPLDLIPPRPGPDTMQRDARPPEPWGRVYSFGNGTVRVVNGQRSGIWVMDIELINRLVEAVQHPSSRINSYTFFLADHLEPTPRNGRPARQGSGLVDWGFAPDTHAITSRMVPGTIREDVFDLPGRSGVYHAYVVGITPERDAYGIFAFDDPAAIREPASIIGFGWTTRLIQLGTAAVREDTMQMITEPWLRDYQIYRIQNEESFMFVTR